MDFVDTSANTHAHNLFADYFWEFFFQQIVVLLVMNIMLLFVYFMKNNRPYPTNFLGQHIEVMFSLAFHALIYRNM